MFTFSEFPCVRSNLNTLRFLFCAFKFHKNVYQSFSNACLDIGWFRNRIVAAENLHVLRWSYVQLNMHRKIPKNSNAEQVSSAVTTLTFMPEWF